MNNYSSYNDLSRYKEIIKEAISSEMIVHTYLPQTNIKGGRIVCPIHGGEHYNMDIKNNLFFCHTCKFSGDVISLTGKLFGTDFKQSLEKLNSDFGLGLVFNHRPTLKEQYEAKKRYEEIISVQTEKDELRALKQSYWDKCDEYDELSPLIAELKEYELTESEAESLANGQARLQLLKFEIEELTKIVFTKRRA